MNIPKTITGVVFRHEADLLDVSMSQYDKRWAVGFTKVTARFGDDEISWTVDPPNAPPLGTTVTFTVSVGGGRP
jgi:hypothetical protein